MSNELGVLLLASFCSFLISYGIMPSIIDLAYQKKLFDTLSPRKVHTQQIPSLGGIAIFIGVLITFTAFVSAELFFTYKYILIAYLVLFFTGLKDDLVPMQALSKLLIQIVVAVLLIHGGIQITSMNGLFGMETLGNIASYMLSILFIVGITNAFNLIDGVDGLAGGLGGISCVSLGILLYWIGENNYAILGFAITGSLLAFLRFNFASYPNKLFMGDAGSLLLGLTVTILAIRFIESPLVLEKLSIVSPFGIVAGVLFIPVFDMFRVSIIRLSKGKSPFVGDKTHIHHEFLSSGLNHKITSILLYVGNLALILTVLIFRNQPTIILLILTLVVGTIFIYFLIRWRYHKRNTKIHRLKNELKKLEKDNFLIS